MARVTGIGGVFFKARDREHLLAWYDEHLGIRTEEWGAAFYWRDQNNPGRLGHTVWSPYAATTRYFAPSEAPFMINYRVDNLDEMLAQLRAAGAQVMDRVEEHEYGRFGWAIDPEGNKLELWEPKGEESQVS